MINSRILSLLLYASSIPIMVRCGEQEVANGFLNHDNFEDSVTIQKYLYSIQSAGTDTKCQQGVLNIYLNAKNERRDEFITVDKIFSNECTDYEDGYFPKIINNELIVNYFIGADKLRIDAYFELSDKKLMLNRFEKMFLYAEAEDCRSFQINVDFKKSQITALDLSNETPIILLTEKYDTKNWDSSNFNYFEVYWGHDLLSFQGKVEKILCNNSSKF